MNTEDALKKGKRDGGSGFDMNKDMQNAPAAIREAYEAGWHEAQKEGNKPSN